MAATPHKPEWPPIREWFFATPRRSLPPLENLTIMTCNNGHPAMGLMERSLEHLGVSCLVVGQGVNPWVNSVHKPRAVVEAARRVTTPYLVYVDSRDAIFVDAPHILVERFETFSCDMVFSADRLNWPQVKAFKKFEDALEGARESEFRYLNGGAWMGRTAFCLEVFRTGPAHRAGAGGSRVRAGNPQEASPGARSAGAPGLPVRDVPEYRVRGDAHLQS